MQAAEKRSELTLEFDPEKILKAALKRGGDFADIYLEDTSNTSIICEEDKIEKVLTGRDRGCGVRVISGLKTYYAYTNDINEASLTAVADTVSNAVKDGVCGSDISLSSNVFAPGFGIKSPPAGIELSEKIILVKRGNDRARGYDGPIKQVKVVYGDASRQIAMINSDGEWVEEARTSLLYLCQVIAEKGGILQTGYEPVGGTIGLELLDDYTPEDIADTAAKRAILMLDAAPAPAGMMPVVLSSEAGGTMVHEAIGHGLEIDLAGQGLSVYSNKLGTKVAADIISVVDDGTIPFKRGSCFFDDEGSPTEKTTLVKNGVLKQYMFDRLGAMKEGKRSTGNGRRESYHHRPIPRMTNTLIMPGESDPDDILASLDKGLFVRKMGGGQVDTVTGDFVFEVTEGYRIENGKLGEPVRGATLTGNGPDVLSAIDMVGSDLGYGIGTCGKDGQGVPVSDAQPTIRIPEIVVGGGVDSKE